jgi:hypothetical protein
MFVLDFTSTDFTILDPSFYHRRFYQPGTTDFTSQEPRFYQHRFYQARAKILPAWTTDFRTSVVRALIVKICSKSFRTSCAQPGDLDLASAR